MRLRTCRSEQPHLSATSLGMSGRFTRSVSAVSGTARTLCAVGIPLQAGTGVSLSQQMELPQGRSDVRRWGESWGDANHLGGFLNAYR